MVGMCQRFVIALGSLLLVVGLAGASDASAHPHRSYVPEEGAVSLRAFKPSAFTLSGDCGQWEEGMVWSRWTHARAVGHGKHVTADGSCQPIHVRRVKITFTRPRKFCGHFVFTHVRYVFPHHPRLDKSFDPISDRTC